MNNLILLALVATALGANKQCTKFADLKPDEQYYLRFLTKVDYDKDTSKAFTTDEPETGAYIGFDESTDAYSNFKIGEKSKFTIEKVQNGMRVRSTDSKLADDAYNQKRTFYWQKGGIMGYYMHKSSANDYIDLYTLLMYDSENYSLKAAQGNPANPIKLATHDVEGDTAIYPQNSNAKVKESKFCFQNVAFDFEKIEKALTEELSKLNEQDKKDAIEWIKKNVSTLKDKEEEKIKQAFNDYLKDQKTKKIKEILNNLKTETGKKYQKEHKNEKETIQKYIEKALERKELADIKEKDVEAALEKYYKENNFAQYGVFGALVCLLALH